MHALENPRPLDLKMVDAQQARRILDRLVGYELSPFCGAKSPEDYLPAVCNPWLCVWSLNAKEKLRPSMPRILGDRGFVL